MHLVSVSLLILPSTLHTGVHCTIYNAQPPEHPPYGRDQNESAHPPYGGCSRVPGAPEGEQTYFLVGNN